MKMKKEVVGILLACALIFPTITAALTYNNKSVGQLQSTYASGDCIFFTLDGVTQADPVRPNDPWFAISRAQFGSKDAYAMLLAVKLSGQTVTVRTSGTLACGYASVEAVTLQ